MYTNPSMPQLAADVQRGRPGAAETFLQHLLPHMERMLRRALRSGSRSPLEVKLRQAAVDAGGDVTAVAKALCADSAARLRRDPDTAEAAHGTQLAAAAWNAPTAVV